MVSFEDNYRYLGDLPFVVYFDFETIAKSDLFQGKKMYVLSYYIIIAFHLKLDIERIVIYCSFQQNGDQYFDVSNLKVKMLQLVDRMTLNQLKDAGLKVYLKESSFALSEVFSVELKFTTDLLFKWFYSVYKIRFLELETITKQKHEINNKVDWSKTDCCICDFKLSLGATYGPNCSKFVFAKSIRQRSVQ